jgi:hypothetical protein
VQEQAQHNLSSFQDESSLPHSVSGEMAGSPVPMACGQTMARTPARYSVQRRHPAPSTQEQQGGNMQKFWCGVVARDHGKLGERGGFCQIGSGKKAPLARMAVGDGIVFYSPVTAFAGKEKCQSFTAIGTVVGADAYAFEITPAFVPYRRAVRYRACQDAAIRPLIDQLVITAGFSNWGYKFRLGHFELGVADFRLIEQAMQAGAELDATAPRRGRRAAVA